MDPYHLCQIDIEVPKQLEDKVRLTGDDVTLCCNAGGDPEIEYYEW